MSIPSCRGVPPAGVRSAAQRLARDAAAAELHGWQTHPDVVALRVAEARLAGTPGVVVTPAWVRGVTGCSRGLSSKVAAALNTDPPTPVDDQTPQSRTGPEGSAA